MNQPVESQIITSGNKTKEGEMKSKSGNVFSTKLGNSGVVAELEIDVLLKIGDNTELLKSGGNFGDNNSSSSESNDEINKSRRDGRVPFQK
jgi:hypothetical protein